MKTKILGGIFSLAVMVAISYGVDKSMKKDADLSEMALSNMKAFAKDNINPDCPIIILPNFTTMIRTIESLCL